MIVDLKRQSRAILAGAIAAVFLASPAWSTEYLCEVPRALLCDGCASHIAIALQPGGNCRISFTPASVDPQTPSHESERVEFQVQLAPQPIQHRVAFRRQQTAVFAKSSPSRRCFVFNASEYCE
jgi:hypothetical protein